MKLFKVKKLKFKEDTSQSIPVYFSSNIPESFGRYRIAVGSKFVSVSFESGFGHETWQGRDRGNYKSAKEECQRHYEKKIAQDHLIAVVSINARLL